MKKLISILWAIQSMAAFSQAPIISSFSPSSGSTGTSVTITGSGFGVNAANNKVYVGNSLATITSASATQLVVTTPAAASGNLLLKVINTASSKSAISNKGFITLFSGGISAAGAINSQFPLSNSMTGPDLTGEFSSPYAGLKCTSGDFDGDGKIDFATMGTTASNSMTVFANNSSAGVAISSSGFSGVTNLTLDANTYTVTTKPEDLNNDGKLDILTGRSNGFTVFSNTSSGAGNFSFSKSTFTPSASFASQKTIAADLDNDGLPEVIAINPDATPMLVSIYKNTTTSGTINFNTTPVNISTSLKVGDIVATDLDNDGDKDLVISSSSGSTNQIIYYIQNNNTTAGTISLASTPVTLFGLLPAGGYSAPVAIASGDFDADGDIDLVSVTKGGTSAPNGLVCVHRNDGAFSFTSFFTGNFVSSSNITYTVLVSDMNGDGRPDIVFGEQNSGGLFTLLNNYSSGLLSTSSFSNNSSFSIGNLVRGLVIDDFNNDGKIDIIYARYYSNQVYLMTNGGSPFYPKSGAPLDLSVVTNWSASPDGTGSSPANFTATANNFILSNSANHTSFSLANNMSIAGTITVPAGATLDLDNRTLTVTNRLVNEGTISTSSGNLILAGSAGQTCSGNFGNLTINNSSGVTLSGNAVINNTLTLSAGTLNIGASELIVKGSIARTSGNINATSGTIHYNGTSAQAINASVYSGAINTLRINNSAGVTLSTNLTTGMLTLNNGLLDASSYILTTSANSGGSATSYVKTSNSNGGLKTSVPNGAIVNFPVGLSAYNPCSITNNSGAADDFSVFILDELYYNSVSGAAVSVPRVQRTWNISKTNANGGSGVDLVLNWNSGEANGVTLPALYHYIGGQWQKQTGSSTNTANSLTYAGYTGSFSPFGVADAMSTLPLQLVAFTAKPDGRDVVLQWITAQEDGIRDFVIQQSLNGSTWSDVGNVTATGNMNQHTYLYRHQSPKAGLNQYRLLYISRDGKRNYSSTVSLKIANDNSLVTLQSNVVKGLLPVQVNQPVTILLYAEEGRLVHRSSLKPGMQILNLSNLPAGNYFFQAGNESHRIILQ